MRMLLVAIFCLNLAQTALALGQTNLWEGWWVVLGSIRDDGGRAPHDAMERLRRKFAACGIEIFNDASAKFDGFSPGYLVAVVGAYRSKASARDALDEARACDPAAYVKRARYLGE